MMNDINWRAMDDEATWVMLNSYPTRTCPGIRVLVETEVAVRVDYVDNIVDDPRFGPYLTTANERVLRIAFF